MEQLAILNNITSMTVEQQEAAAMHFEIVQASKFKGALRGALADVLADLEGGAA